MMKSTKEKAATRSHKIDYRVNDEEYAQIAAAAKTCGLSVSDYCRRVILGYQPKNHLTERGLEVYQKFADARCALVNIRSALHGRTQEQIIAYFGDEEFMKEWIGCINGVIAQWDDIVAELKN